MFNEKDLRLLQKRCFLKANTTAELVNMKSKSHLTTTKISTFFGKFMHSNFG